MLILLIEVVEPSNPTSIGVSIGIPIGSPPGLATSGCDIVPAVNVLGTYPNHSTP